jgi:hypothetical protein
MLPRNLFS